jgi:hypothetical protein
MVAVIVEDVRDQLQAGDSGRVLLASSTANCNPGVKDVVSATSSGNRSCMASSRGENPNWNASKIGWRISKDTFNFLGYFNCGESRDTQVRTLTPFFPH